MTFSGSTGKALRTGSIIVEGDIDTRMGISMICGAIYVKGNVKEPMGNVAFVGRFSYSLDFTFWKSSMGRYIILIGTFYYTRSKTHSCFRKIMASFMDEIYVSKNLQPSLPICYNNQVGISSFSSFVLEPTAH